MSEPVAWIDPKELDMDVSTSVTKNKQFESDIPLYVQPQKYCPSENNEAYEKGFIDGMAKQRDSKVQQMVEGYTHPVKDLDEQFKKGFKAGKEEGWKAHKFHHPVKELTDEEIIKVNEDIGTCWDVPHRFAIQIARAILRKAQEK